MNCPKCHAAMEQVAVSNIRVDRCTGCKGIWFDAGEMRRLAETKGATTVDVGNAETGKQQNRQGDIECPLCHVKMVKMADVDQHHIWYESCPACKGTFLDAGEFKDLAHYTIADYLRGLFVKERH